MSIALILDHTSSTPPFSIQSLFPTSSTKEDVTESTARPRHSRRKPLKTTAGKVQARRPHINIDAVLEEIGEAESDGDDAPALYTTPYLKPGTLRKRKRNTSDESQTPDGSNQFPKTKKARSSTPPSSPPIIVEPPRPMKPVPKMSTQQWLDNHEENNPSPAKPSSSSQHGDEENATGPSNKTAPSRQTPDTSRPPLAVKANIGNLQLPESSDKKKKQGIQDKENIPPFFCEPRTEVIKGFHQDILNKHAIAVCKAKKYPTNPRELSEHQLEVVKGAAFTKAKIDQEQKSLETTLRAYFRLENRWKENDSLPINEKHHYRKTQRDIENEMLSNKHNYTAAKEALKILCKDDVVPSFEAACKKESKRRLEASSRKAAAEKAKLKTEQDQKSQKASGLARSRPARHPRSLSPSVLKRKREDGDEDQENRRPRNEAEVRQLNYDKEYNSRPILPSPKRQRIAHASCDDNEPKKLNGNYLHIISGQAEAQARIKKEEKLRQEEAKARKDRRDTEYHQRHKEAATSQEKDRRRRLMAYDNAAAARHGVHTPPPPPAPQGVDRYLPQTPRAPRYSDHHLPPPPSRPGSHALPPRPSQSRTQPPTQVQAQPPSLMPDFDPTVKVDW